MSKKKKNALAKKSTSPLDKEKASAWVNGQIRLDDGSLVRFEFSPDEKHGGGEIVIKPPSGEPVGLQISGEQLNASAKVLGEGLKSLLEKGKTLFTKHEIPKLPSSKGR